MVITRGKMRPALEPATDLAKSYMKPTSSSSRLCSRPGTFLIPPLRYTASTIRRMTRSASSTPTSVFVR